MPGELDVNKKLNDLALQAGGSHFPGVGGKNLEKFAELLIKECVMIVKNRGAFLRYDALADEMQKHFGVDLD